MAKNYAHAGLWSRPAAIVWALTLGLVIGIAVTVLGTIYGIVGTVLRLAGQGDHQTYRPVGGPVAETINWWTNLMFYAVSGRGEFTLVPEVYDP